MQGSDPGSVGGGGDPMLAAQETGGLCVRVRVCVEGMPDLFVDPDLQGPLTGT